MKSLHYLCDRFQITQCSKCYLEGENVMLKTIEKANKSTDKPLIFKSLRISKENRTTLSKSITKENIIYLCQGYRSYDRVFHTKVNFKDCLLQKQSII